MIHLSHYESSTELLGPFSRFVIWVHGCCFDCPGCLAQNTRFGEYENVECSVLAHRIVESGCEGVTISGGEPFLQAGELAGMLRIARASRDIGVIVYSGFTLTELRERPCAGELLSQCDILIDGRYVRELDDGRAYVGSSNQTIHYLTDRYKAVGQEYYDASGKRKCEIKFTEKQAVLIGVPSAGVLEMWQKIKKKAGNEL